MSKNSIKNIFEIKSIKLDLKTINSIFTNLKKYIKSDHKILIAVSGGSDSILLSSIIRTYFIENNYNKENIFFLHLNHKTRNNNLKDETFVKDFFEGANLIIKTRNNNLKSTENNLRNRRYNEIKKTSIKHKIDLILFGHNLTDRIESSFMNMLRGCGLQGLQSMLIKQDHHLLKKPILRPLLDLTKEEIQQICKKYKIPHIHDETNDDPSTSLRNLIRITILPQIYKLSNKKNRSTNSFIQSMQRIYKQLEEKDSDTNYLKDIIKSPYWNCKFGYELNIFKKLLTQDQFVNITKKLGIYKNINSNLVKEVTDFIINKDDGFKYFNQTYFIISHNKVYIIQAPEKFWIKAIDKKVPINKLGTIDLGKLKIKIEDKNLIGGILRFPQNGDRFRNKTRNQYCSDQKIPVFWRNFIPIVEKNGKIVFNFKDIFYII